MIGFDWGDIWLPVVKRWYMAFAILSCICICICVCVCVYVCICIYIFNLIRFDWVDINWQLWLKWCMAFAIWCVASKRYFHQAGFDQLKRLTLDRWARLRAKCFHAWTSSCQHCDSVNFENEMNFNLYCSNLLARICYVYPQHVSWCVYSQHTCYI